MKHKMNTDFLTQRREGAKVSLQEPGEFLVKGFGHLRFDTPRQSLSPSKWANHILPCDTFASHLASLGAGVGQEVWKNLMGSFFFRDPLSINQRQFRKKKKLVGGSLKQGEIFTHQPIRKKTFSRFRVVGDAFDGLFHGTQLNHGWTRGDTDFSTLRNEWPGEKCGNGCHEAWASIALIIEVHSTRATMPPVMGGVKKLKDYAN